MSDVSGTAPADPAPAPNPPYRVMLSIVIGLGLLIVVMFVLVVAKLFSAMQGHAAGAAAPDRPAIFTLAPGAKILSAETENSRLVLHIHNPSGDEIDIIDTDTGRLVGQVKTAQPTK